MATAGASSKDEDTASTASRLRSVAAAAPVTPLPPWSGDKTAVRRRAVAAVVGAACADAASMGLHWVYDMEKMRALTGGREASAAFHEPPADAFYTYPSGMPSPHGQQTAALLHSLVETRGFSAAAYAARNFEAFGIDFEAQGGYLDASTRGFLREVRNGAAWPGATGVDDWQANCIARLPPIVAAFAGDAMLLPRVEEALRVTQNSDVAVAWGTAAARVLEGVILGATPVQAVHATMAALEVRGVGVPWLGLLASRRR
jgi:ADP-ribosylglycohydrolase